MHVGLRFVSLNVGEPGQIPKFKYLGTVRAIFIIPDSPIF